MGWHRLLLSLHLHLHLSHWDWWCLTRCCHHRVSRRMRLRLLRRYARPFGWCLGVSAGRGHPPPVVAAGPSWDAIDVAGVFHCATTAAASAEWHRIRSQPWRSGGRRSPSSCIGIFCLSMSRRNKKRPPGLMCCFYEDPVRVPDFHLGSYFCSRPGAQARPGRQQRRPTSAEARGWPSVTATLRISQ